VSRGRNKAKQIDEAVINRARLVADYCLTFYPITDEEAVKEDRRRTLRNAEDYLADVGTPRFEVNIQNAAYCASSGARHWVELCLALAAHFVERGEPAPEPIRKLAANALRELRLREYQTDKKGDETVAKRSDRSMRDFTIAATVHMIVIDTGLKPTRNKAQRTTGSPSSACSIVHEALRLRKVNLGEDAVETAWRTHGKQMEKTVERMVAGGLKLPSPNNPFPLKEFY
jgi:hypothetical protein